MRTLLTKLLLAAIVAIGLNSCGDVSPPRGSTTKTTFEQAREISVITFNTGLLQLNVGPIDIDLVSCVEERRKAQQKTIFANVPGAFIRNLKDENKGFVLNLQEVWNEETYNLFKRSADKLGLATIPRFFSPTTVEASGLVTVTNLDVQGYAFVPFKTNHSVKSKGMLKLNLALGNDQFSIINTHTDYSDFKKPYQSHMAQLQELAEFSKADPNILIVSGDLNAGPDTGFRAETYNSSQQLWRDSFMSHLDGVFETVFDESAPTWSNANKVATTLPAFTQFLEGVKNWDDLDGALDHILWRSQKRIQLVEQSLVFDQEVDIPSTCYLETDKLHLSDHFGVHAQFKLL